MENGEGKMENGERRAFGISRATPSPMNGKGKMENGEKPQRDLRERTFKFARQVVKLFVSLDRGVLAQTLGRQMLRAGTSVGANYREADQARSKAEFVAKIGDCLKEADETAYWLELIAAEAVAAP